MVSKDSLFEGYVWICMEGCFVVIHSSVWELIKNVSCNYYYKRKRPWFDQALYINYVTENPSSYKSTI